MISDYSWKGTFLGTGMATTYISNYRITIWTSGEYINNTNYTTTNPSTGAESIITNPFTGTGSGIVVAPLSQNSGPFVTATK